jgi:uncharacterized damage-inducible protein DinB
MTIPELLLLEFDEEMASTRRFLVRWPAASLTWKPHEKSMTLGRLASHVADLPNRCVAIISSDAYVRPPDFKPFLGGTTQEILDHFDTASTEARARLATLREDQLAGVWSISIGGRIVNSLPRAMALRRIFMNHLIHHRGQLGVDLRLLDVAVPGMYGPSADDQARM